MQFVGEFLLNKSYFHTFKICENFIILSVKIFHKYFTKFHSKLKKIYFSNYQLFMMEENRIYNFNEYLRAQRKEQIRKKSKKSNNSKTSKINNFRNSIGKLFRMKSQSEKSLKRDDIHVETIPSTIYLSPNASLPRDGKSLNKPQFIPKIHTENNVARHSCSDFTCRRSNTFCIYAPNKEINKSEQNLKTNKRLISPPNSAFYPITMDEYDEYKIHLPIKNVPHSKSVPLQLSQSQQNINHCKKSNIDIQSSAKRNARKKSIFNCSLFRKRSNSRSKSTDKIHQQKPSMIKCFDKLKNQPQLIDEPSNLSDRCLTLPNLKSSEVDLTSHVNNNAQLLSIDLIKDYLNRSDNALPTTVQSNSVDNSSYYQYNSQNHSTVSVQNSPLSLPNRKSINESRILENTKPNPKTTSAYSDVYSGKSIQICDSLSVNNSALEGNIYNNNTNNNNNNNNNFVELNQFIHNTQRSRFTRQTSAPQYLSQQTKSNLPHVSPPSGAVEFWTRPYQEKIKASRRRLLDDKVGSKEALLRSMSPQNIRIYEGESLYDTTYHLQMIPEPTHSIFMEESDCRTNLITSAESIIRSHSFYSSIAQDFHLLNHRNPHLENRLSESPNININRQEPIDNIYSNNYVDYDEKSVIIEENQKRIPREEFNAIKTPIRSKPEILDNQKIKSYFSSHASNFEDSLSRIKDLKNNRLSQEFIVTRTPTPPHSFAESSISSAAPPVPKEFLNNSSLSIAKPNYHCGNINLLYSSDNSSGSHEEFCDLDHDFVPPVPPPRTDSVIRSMNFQQNNDADKSELEYDITDDFLPIFSGANIDKCDIEQYHKWLEKLPYKLSEFPDILHSRKSTVTAKKSILTEELIDIVPEKIEQLDLKHLKSYRKSIKSWNMSDSSKIDYEATNDSNNNGSINEPNSMKKSFSCDHSLHSSDKTSSNDELDHQAILSQNLTTTETTLLKQYSHLYSLKFSPSQNNIIDSIQSVSILKSNRSKSIDLRNFLSNNKTCRLINSGKCSENRKSAPNNKIQLEK